MTLQFLGISLEIVGVLCHVIRVSRNVIGLLGNVLRSLQRIVDFLAELLQAPLAHRPSFVEQITRLVDDLEDLDSDITVDTELSAVPQTEDAVHRAFSVLSIVLGEVEFAQLDQMLDRVLPVLLTGSRLKPLYQLVPNLAEEPWESPSELAPS